MIDETINQKTQGGLLTISETLNIVNSRKVSWRGPDTLLLIVESMFNFSISQKQFEVARPFDDQKLNRVLS